MTQERHITFKSATALVIANMVGTGVFTSLGFQLIGISSPAIILILWGIGGLLALSGAFVYAELGISMPRNGAEYLYLSKLIHPSIGFSSGFVSSMVGFSAPVALAAMTLGTYSQDIFPSINKTWIAMSVVVLISTIHLISIKSGFRFQNFATVIKVSLIIAFITAGLLSPYNFEADSSFRHINWKELFSKPFAISLIYVSYAYSGWNASAYIAGEMKNPLTDLPRSLMFGTLVVIILYVLLNFTFLSTAPINELKGKIDVGYISAAYIFSDIGAKIMGWVISLLLISSLSAMIIAGSRVTAAMGENTYLLKFLSYRSNMGNPYVAILFQMIISLTLILTSEFENVLTYIGFSLSFFTVLTVAGIFILRKHENNSTSVITCSANKNSNFPTSEKKYRTWGYPITPLIFMGVNIWVMIYTAIEKPTESILGFLTVFSGVIIYYVDQKVTNKKI